MLTFKRKRRDDDLNRPRTPINEVPVHKHDVLLRGMSREREQVEVVVELACPIATNVTSSTNDKNINPWGKRSIQIP